MPRDLESSLHATLSHYKFPLIIAATGAALSILAFLAVLSSQLQERREEFVLFAQTQALLLADQFHYANQQLKQLSAYASAVGDMDFDRFEVFAHQLLSEHGLAYAGWRSVDGRTIGMWRGTREAVVTGPNEADGRHAPRAAEARGEVALIRIPDTGLANVAQLMAVAPVASGNGSVIARVDVSELVVATQTTALPTVLHLLDDQGATVYRSNARDAREFEREYRSARNAGYYVQRALTLFGRTWHVAIFPPTTYLIGQTGPYPWLVLAFSLSITVMLGFIAFQQAHQTVTVRKRVADQTFAIRTMAEASVRTEARLQAIFDHSVDGLITIDQNGIVEDYNPACERLFGYSAREVIGRNIRMLMPEPLRSSHDGYLKNYLETGEAKIIGIGREVRAQRKDGTTFPMELAVAEMRDGEQLRFSGVIRDITERQELMAGLRASNEELERFAYVASHDLKAPLRAIDNLSQWIAEDLGDRLEGEAGRHMALLRDRVRRMDRLLDDLLDYSRVGRSDCESTFEVTTARAVVEDVLALVEPSPAFEIEIGPALADIPVNRMPLQLVFHNLIGNAIKHHDRADGRIAVEAERHADSYTFRIRDDGPGIDAAHHARIFDMFQTLKPRDEVEGSGIGLALVKKIVEQHGGTIDVESRVGCGAEFSFRWPRRLRRIEHGHAA